MIGNIFYGRADPHHTPANTYELASVNISALTGVDCVFVSYLFISPCLFSIQENERVKNTYLGSSRVRLLVHMGRGKIKRSCSESTRERKLAIE